MNKQQKAYILAKAVYETALHEQRAAEIEYITKHSIKNSDGTTPRSIYSIEDDSICDQAFEALAEYDAKRYEAFQALTKAEDDLIEYGLSIAPASVAETLRSVKDNLKYRKKLVDLTFRLDTKTVKGGL
jgi:hypothetical protein